MVSRKWHRLSLLLTFALVASLALAPLGAAQGEEEPQAAQRLLPAEVKPPADRAAALAPAQAADQAPLLKLDPALRDLAQQGGKETVMVYVTATPDVDLSAYLQQMIARPVVFGGVRNVYGLAKAGDLLTIAGMEGVSGIVLAEKTLRDLPYDAERADAPDRALALERLNALRANDLPWAASAAAQEDAGIAGWFDVRDGHQSSAAWQKGFTGQDVIVGVLDDGIDFGHPDLQGTYAVVSDPASPYYGWPMAFSQVSMYYFVYEVYLQDLGARGITQGWNGSRWADTQTERTITDPQTALTGTVSYQPLNAASAHDYTVPKTSKSGVYKLGSLPEKNLLAVFGERVAILVVDEHSAGVYDTVYVDLDNDYDFTDEKPVTKDSPEVWRDLDGDGYADISGGLLVWISDGANVPPTADWLWGVSCGDEVGTLKACPDSGSLLQFAGAFDGGYTHGTQCASNIAGQGKVSAGLTAQPFRKGGMVQGAAPKVGLMDFGNHYYQGTDEDEFLVAALGYDGIPMSGDEVQITSNSYGAFSQMWGAWGYMGRLITSLNLSIAPHTVWVFSAGNEGPGYGPQEGDSSPTTIQVGSSTQFGSTNWDSIFSADQIVYGDVTSFFSKGPNRDGTSGLDVLANGGRGSGDEGINYYGFNGAESWATWGGTSRSAPVAAGNLALIYQAYKARYGSWPTWDVAKALLKSGANNASSSPFYQGAGVVNADRSVDLAAGIYGVYAMPDEWQVGDWQGEEYLNFAKVAKPGEVYLKTYTLVNPSGYDLTVDLSDGVMTLMDKVELTFTTQPSAEESGFNFHSPDYLMKLDPALIPPDAELMVVRYVHPYSTFDRVYDFTPNANSSWRFMLYNWTDQNGDGKLWVDANGNGVVNHSDLPLWDNDGFQRLDFANSEIQEGEYIRMDYEFGGLAVPIFVRDPLARMADGYYFGWQHRHNDGTVGPTTFKIGVEFYQRADWDWLTLSDDEVFVPAEGVAAFQAQMAIPTDAPFGAYEGVIYMQVPGDLLHQGYEVALPVVVNVLADLPDDGMITLGGGPLADTLYQNSWTHGYFNWYGGGWTGAGDWRHYFFELDEADVAKGYLLVHTSWDDAYPTDINTWVLGPTKDCASNGEEPCAWYQPGLGMPDPSVYGPYTLQPIGWSEPFMSGAAYPFRTSTGGPDDWLLIKVTEPGLYAIALHNVLYSGEELAAQFQVEVGTLDIQGVLALGEGAVLVNPTEFAVYQESGLVDLQFTPTLGFDSLEATLSGGLETEDYGPYDVFVPDTGGCYSAWCPGNVYEPFVITRDDVTKLTVHLEVPPAQDADLFLVYDANDNGAPEEGIDPVIGASGNSAGVDEEIVVMYPAAGRYFAVMDGYDVDPDSGVWMEWWWSIMAAGALPSEQVADFKDSVPVYQDPPQWYTASYTHTITVDERTAALYARVSDIPVTADIDLVVTDGSGTPVAWSFNFDQEDEEVAIYAELPGYRLTPGETYTFYVHGWWVSAPPAMPTLTIWHDQLNLWLSATDDDVNVLSGGIDPNETVSVFLHYDKADWEPGDPPLTARLVAGPDGLPNAFDELVILNREEAPGEPVWNPENLLIDLSAHSARGPSAARWSIGGVPISTARIAPSERVTYTVTIQNLDDLPTPRLLADVWPLPEDYLGMWFGFPNRVNGAAYGLILGTHNTVDYDGGIQWWGQLQPGASVQFSFWVEMPADMPLGGDHVAGVDVYDRDTWEWYGWDLAGAWYRAFGTTGSFKSSFRDEVIPGEVFTYTILLANRGAEDRDVTVVDPLPAEVEYLSHTGGGSYNAGNHTFTWLTTMPGDVSTQQVEIQVRAKTTLAYGSTFINTASVRDRYTDALLAQLSDLLYVGTGAGLTLDKKANKLVAAYNETIQYTITLGNEGVEAAKNVWMVDEIPVYLDIIPASVWASKASACAPLYTGGSVEWCGNVAPGEFVTVRFQAKVNANAHKGLALINGAWATADNYPTALYDSALTEVLFMSKNYMPYIFAEAPFAQPF